MKKFFEVTLLVSLLGIILVGGLMISSDRDQGPSQGLREAVVMYESGRYSDAIESLEQEGADPMIIGNAYYHLGSSLEDPDQQMAMYQQALKAYEGAILDNPMTLPVKYNYEFVKAQLNQEEASPEDSQDQQEQENQEESNQDDSQESGQSDQGQESQDEDQEAQDNQEDSSEEGQEEHQQEAGQDDQASEDQLSETVDSEDQASEPIDEETLEQILQLLESQEAESLKNNQEMIQGSQGDGNDW